MADIVTELDLLIAEREHVQRVDALKNATQADPGNKELAAEYRAAKLAHREFRQTWRTIRRMQLDAAIDGDQAALDAFRAQLGDGGAAAAPDTVNVSVEGN